MEHFKNFFIMIYGVAAIVTGVIALCTALFQYHNYAQAIFIVLPLVAAYPTLIKWIKDAYNREHGNK